MGFKETFSINGEKLVDKVKELINEGNVRKITILNKDGRELASFPLTIGVVGVVLAPVFAAIGALAALVGDCTLTVERDDPEPTPAPPDPAAGHTFGTEPGQSMDTDMGA